MPRSKPERHECAKHPGETETWAWEWPKGGSRESSEPVCLTSCPLCDDERELAEADEFEESGEKHAASILRSRVAARKAKR